MGVAAKAVALVKGVLEQFGITLTTTSTGTATATTAVILGAPTTGGVRLDLESGDLAVREGDDTGYANLLVNNLTIAGTTTGFTPTLSMVVVTRATAQSINDSTATDVSWTAEVRDDLGISAVGPGANVKICTFTAAGVWEATSSIQWAANALGARALNLTLYDSADTPKWSGPTASGSAGAVVPNYQTVSATFRVASGDYVKAVLYQTSTGALDVGATVTTHCTLTRMGL